jgi:hypothetical protein
VPEEALKVEANREIACRRNYRLTCVGICVASTNETLTDANAASMYGPEVIAK